MVSREGKQQLWRRTAPCVCLCVWVRACVGQEEREAGLPGRLCAGVGR